MIDDDIEKQSKTPGRDRQLAALVSSGTIIVFFLVYWFAQIDEVREMLKLAYG